MPVLIKRFFDRESAAPMAMEVMPSPLTDIPQPEATLLPYCGYAGCKSGWMKLWRKRQNPVLEGRWACSPACMQEMVRAAVLREAAEQNLPKGMHQHRMPLGLILLSRGSITQEQLRCALEAQKKAAGGRLGEWLVRQGAIDEEQVTRALSMQWSCPVLTATPHDPVRMSAAFPRLFIDSFGVIPLRLAGRHLLYVAFEDRIDRCLVLAIERVLGLKVEAGLLRTSEFRRLQQEILRVPSPRARLLEAANVRGLMLAFSTMIEERRAVRSQIVRVHDYFWLRIWRGSSLAGADSALSSAGEVEDMVCTLAARE